MRNRHRLPPSSWGDGLRKVGGPERKEPGIPEGILAQPVITNANARSIAITLRGIVAPFETRPPSLFAGVSDRETIEPGCKAHKPADSGVVVGKGARMRGLAEGAEQSVRRASQLW